MKSTQAITATQSGIKKLALLTLAAGTLSAPGQAAGHEGYPVLKARELLRADVLKGPYHTVLGSVPTQGFANQYTVQTPWGVFHVRGNHLLAKRIHEFQAIARLENASKSDEFKKGLASAAAKPFYAVGGALQDPIGAVEKIGGGVGRLIEGVGEKLERGGKKSANTDNALQGILGFSKAKREIAGYLKVDPYTDNKILQKKLDEMARANFAGGFVIRAGTFALGTGADVGVASVAGAVSFTSNIANLVYSNDPTSLSRLNRETLKKLGVSAAGAAAFVENPVVSPSEQTEMTGHLARLGPVPGMEDYLKMAGASRDAADVAFFVNTAAMMATYHHKVSPLKRILNLYGLPAIHAENNALVIPLAMDYASWSGEADRLSAALAGYKPQVTISKRLLYISGRVSDTARAQFVERGFVVADEAYVPLYR